MDKLINILETMQRSEKQKLRAYIKINSKEEYSLKEQLLDILINNPDKEETHIRKKLYGKEDATYFPSLKKKLLEDMISVIVAQDDSKLYKDDIPKNRIQCLRLYVAGRWLVNKGGQGIEVGVQLLEKADRITHTYGFFNEALLIKDVLRVSVGLKKGIKYLETKNREISELCKKVNSLYVTKGCAYEVAFHEGFTTNIDEARIARIKQKINDTLEISDNANDAQVLFWKEYMLAIYSILIKDYTGSLKHYDELLDILQDKSVYGFHRQIAVMQDKSNALFRLGEFSSLKESIQKLMQEEGDISNKHYLFRFMELELRIAIQEKDNEAFNTIYTNLINNKWGKTETNKNRLKLFEAFFNYQIEEKNKALEILSDVNEITKDKSGWLLGVYYLKMIILFDLEEYYALDFHIKNFDHLLFRQKKNNVTRTKAIVKVFKTLLRKHLNYEDTYEKHEDLFELLSSNDLSFYWDPLGFEVIRFDTWFTNKLDKSGSRATEN